MLHVPPTQSIRSMFAEKVSGLKVLPPVCNSLHFVRDSHAKQAFETANGFIVSPDFVIESNVAGGALRGRIEVIIISFSLFCLRLQFLFPLRTKYTRYVPRFASLFPYI